MQGDKASVTVTNNGQGSLFVRQINSSAPLEVVKEKVMSGMSMSVRYYNDKGTPLNIEQLQQGEDITTEITIKNTGLTGTYQELALNYPVPSGFEIINDRLTGNTSAWKEAEYVDIRDDRFYVYFSLEQISLRLSVSVAMQRSAENICYRQFIVQLCTTIVYRLFYREEK